MDAREVVRHGRVITYLVDEYFDLMCSEVLGVELCFKFTPEIGEDGYYITIDSHLIGHVYFKNSKNGNVFRPYLIERFP
jgi:hypothetical protein